MGISYLVNKAKAPRESLTSLFQRFFCNTLSDKTYLQFVFYLRFGKVLNLKRPQTFNEKLNWLKLNKRFDVFTTMADKYSVKELVSNKIGDQYVVKNYGVYKKWEDIDFESLPNQFVIKCTHDSGGAYVCRGKLDFDFENVKNAINKNLNSNFFFWYREWPYKNIPPRIIIDEFLDDHTGGELRDYKFWCFNGKPIYMYCTIKGENVFENFYDMNFNPVRIDHGFPRHQPEFDKPKEFELMKELAEKLAAGVPFVRVDFFDVDGKVYFGEYTFYDWGGMRPFKGDWDLKLGELLNIEE